MKLCIACGMPMKEKSDYAMGDETKDYCKFCARPDGSMQSYDEKLEGMAEFIVRSQGLDREAAKRTAARMMAALPAWQAKA
jgi:hypothetical protein